MTGALLIALLWLASPAPGGSGDTPDGDPPVGLVSQPEELSPSGAGDASPERASPPPVRPPHTPLIERPIEWAWWALWWLPEHWRGEMITFLLAQAAAFVGFLATRTGLRGEDPSHYPRLLRPLVAAFADRAQAAPVLEEEEVTHLRREVARLSGLVAVRTAPSAPQDARLGARVAALEARITPEALARLEAATALLTAALGDDDAPPR